MKAKLKLPWLTLGFNPQNCIKRVSPQSSSLERTEKDPQGLQNSQHVSYIRITDIVIINIMINEFEIVDMINIVSKVEKS